MLLDVAGAAIACTTLMFVFIPNPEKTETETTNNGTPGYEGRLSKDVCNCGLKWVVTEVLITFFIMPVVALITVDDS